MNVDFSGNEIEIELEALLDNKLYTVKLDVVVLTKLEYQPASYPDWKQVEGKLDANGVHA